MLKGYRIISVEAADIYKPEQEYGVAVGYKLPDVKSDAYFWLFKNKLDYSLDSIEIEKAYTRIFRKKFSFVDEHKNSYTLAVVNVNYTYKPAYGKPVYARYSCEKQTEQSIEGQLRVCHEFAERNGYVVVHEYIDRAVSGKTDKREQFQRMLQDSAKKEFDYVLVYKLDRFARNRYDSAINKATLKKNGVKVLSACEQITDSPEGIILESMIEGMAEYYSAELSQNKKYQIVPQEAEIVRKMFDDYVNGTTIKEIKTWLDESGIRTHTGHSFSIGRVSDMLRNQKYIGKCKYDGEVYDNIIMPIVDELTFNRAQEMLVVNSHKSGRVRAGEKFILSGKIICSHCGALYNGESGTCRNGDVHYFYKCRRKNEGKDKCCSHAVPKHVFEDSVYKTIITALKDETFLRHVAEQAVEIHNRQIVEKPELKILRRQLAETEDMLNNITMAICKGIFNEYANQDERAYTS